MSETKTIVLNLPKDMYDKYTKYCKWEERDVTKQTRKLIKDFCELSEYVYNDTTEAQMKEVNKIISEAEAKEQNKILGV